MAAGEFIARGRSALENGRWADARAAFEAALGERETAESLSGMGHALWWLGETRLSVEYHERAFAAFRRSGEADSAAWTAMWLGLTYGADFGNQAAFSGWIARAERVLQDVPASPMQGWLWLVGAHDTSDLAISRERTERALEFARGYGDLDLELCALGQLGEMLVAMGRVEDGLRLVDEAMAGTFGGECSRLDTAVFTSCSMLVACELAADLERATQWCQVADAFIRKYGCPFLHARCRTSYGSILVATGHWAEAERELTAAIRLSQDAYPPMHAQALARLAELRVRQGRYEEAEGLLAGVDSEFAIALPAAAVRLVRGQPDVAVVLLDRHLSLLGEGHVDAAPTLELLVEAHLALGDLIAATATAERLTKLASGRGGDSVAPRAFLASARVSMVKGEPDVAVMQLSEALGRFSRLALPFETARARLELARTLAKDHPAAAVAEAQSALATFERLGAEADADAAASLLRSLGATGRSGPKQVGLLTKREQEVLRLVALGLSNPEIAQRLVISSKTASHHVSSVLAKLGLRNRAEAVAYATRISE